MTREECLVVTAYTGILMTSFPDFHEFVENILGRPVYTHEMGDADFWVEVKRVVRPRFMELCWP